MKNIFKQFMQDIQQAQEHHEEYQRLQVFYKGDNAESKALIEFMHFDYLPKKIIKIIEWKVDLINKFVDWMWDFHRISLLTLVMICSIIYILFR